MTANSEGRKTLFTHYDDPGKCEWIGGALDAFAQHYNVFMGTHYKLTECLDVVRISASTPKQPEVLLTDRQSGQRMVIERKSVVWPRSYLHAHGLEHEFANLIWEATQGRFEDVGYVLTVGIREFGDLSGRQVREAARQIGETLTRLTASDLPTHGASPIRWSFRRSTPEEEIRSGIVVSHTEAMNLDDPARDEALAGLPSQIQAQLDAAAAKFAEYPGETKIVLLDFYCNDLWEDDVPPMMDRIAIPELIDEIWRTVRSWTSPDEYEIGYERLFSRSAERQFAQSETL